MLEQGHASISKRVIFGKIELDRQDHREPVVFEWEAGAQSGCRKKSMVLVDANAMD